MNPDPTPSIDIKRLTEFADLCQKIRRHNFLDTTKLTATNFKEEREKFFKSQTYNPTFSYSPPSQNKESEIREAENFLEKIDLPQDFKLYLTHYLKALRDMNNAVQSIGTDNFADCATQVFNLNTPKIQKYLNMSPEITVTPEEETKLYNAEDIAEVFKQELKNYGIKDYKVEIDTFNDHTVRVGHNKIVLGAKVKRYKKSVERLVHHEIDSHVLQRINTDRINILALTIPADRTLYSEGLAVYNEVHSQKITQKMYQLYSLRVQAVRRLNLTFREIYNELTGTIPDKLAYMVTYRVKRGTHDTSLPGGYPKDSFYLLGYLAVKEYVEIGNDIRNLYYARTPDMYYIAKKYDFFEKGEILLPRFLG